RTQPRVPPRAGRPGRDSRVRKPGHARPRARREPARGSRPEAREARGAHGPGLRGGSRPVNVLVIEDSGPTRSLLARALESDRMTVEVAARFSTGLRQAMAARHDVIVLDLMLPDGDGLDLCRLLRAEGVLTPVLCLTARGDVADRVQGLDAGADDYMKKPFALAELRARIRALARRQGLSPPKRIEAGGVRVDFTARRLERGGKEIPVTAREWAVLEAL